MQAFILLLSLTLGKFLTLYACAHLRALVMTRKSCAVGMCYAISSFLHVNGKFSIICHFAVLLLSNRAMGIAMVASFLFIFVMR